ncbi:MAG: EFR1 family ferrodoxin [Spirochaetes bacterium]|nr:EFR1 family ferrodoxin [Spirochaetota bacterium]
MDTEIYYFTGTGNSLQIAKDLAEQLENAQIIQINSRLMESGKLISADRTGIIFPVYVSGIPVIVEEFVNCLDISENTYMFAVSNFGGSAGISLAQLDSLLRARGSRLSAAFEIRMPDNTQIMFPPGSPEQQERCFRSQKGMMPEIASIINNRAVNYKENSAVPSRPHDFNPRDMEKNFHFDEKCNSCGICEKVCPVGNIEMNSDGKPEWQGKCELCLACMQWCPEEAIQFGDKTSSWGRYHHPEIKVQELFQK